jgi:mono/diheme cytochrome c family protein
MKRILVATVVLQMAAFIPSAEALSPAQQRGRTLVQELCAQCHAIGRADRSPHVGAPPFRALDRRLDLDSFVARLREGLVSGHGDMPMFRFSREDARAVVEYLRLIEAP